MSLKGGIWQTLYTFYTASLVYTHRSQGITRTPKNPRGVFDGVLLPAKAINKFSWRFYYSNHFHDISLKAPLK
jgi:hypothetical protein